MIFDCMRILFFMVLSAFAIEANAGVFYEIWKGREITGKVSERAEDKIVDGKLPDLVRVCNTPTLEFFAVDSPTPTGIVIVCPGGGYGVLCRSYEGVDIAEALVKNGIAAAVLSYRVPSNRDGALADAHRAIRFLRANAKKLNINPDDITIMGFSAGGHLSARAATSKANYQPKDDVDKFSEIPNSTGLIYPAYLDKTHANGYKNVANKPKDFNEMYALSDCVKVDVNTPRAFIVSTLEDFCVDSVLAYYLAMKEAGAPATLQMFDKGKHGFGIKDKTNLNVEWFNLYVKWLRARK